MRVYLISSLTPEDQERALRFLTRIGALPSPRPPSLPALPCGHPLDALTQVLDGHVRGVPHYTDICGLCSTDEK
jgi:hypothetical protein